MKKIFALSISLALLISVCTGCINEQNLEETPSASPAAKSLAPASEEPEAQPSAPATEDTVANETAAATPTPSQASATPSVPNDTYLLNVCPPYDSNECEEYYQAEGNSFSMAGKQYSNGLTFRYNDDGWALFNLDGNYSSIECTIGHVNAQPDEKKVSFIVDGNLVKEVVLEPDCLPKKVSIPLTNGLQLKIVTNTGDYHNKVGIGNIIVK